jgi:hypothetical protein
MVYDTTTGQWKAQQLVAAQIAVDAITSEKIVAGAVVSGKIGDGAIVSGSLASGQVGSNHLASGIAVDAAKYNVETRYNAISAIEAYAGVALQSGVAGALIQANAFDQSLMPAIGITTAAIASGDAADVFFDGVCDMDAAVISGSAGANIFVGSGGLIVTTPPTLSGSIQQKMGEVLNDDKVFVMSNPDTVTIGA